MTKKEKMKLMMIAAMEKQKGLPIPTKEDYYKSRKRNLGTMPTEDDADRRESEHDHEIAKRAFESIRKYKKRK